MATKITATLFSFLLLSNLIYGKANSKVNNSIVVKVGNSVISTIDIQNQIITTLIIQKKELNQKNIDNIKDNTVKLLVNKAVKNSEILKYDITKYNDKDLESYLQNVAKKFNTTQKGLKEIFLSYGVSFDVFIENYKTELLWNSLIYNMYKNQLNVNIIDVENEIEIILKNKILEYNLSEIELPLDEYKDKEKIDNILKLIKKNGFEDTAKKFSVSPTAVNSGLMGWLRVDTMSKQYLNILKNLSVKDVSPYIVNDKSILILKVNKIKQNEKETDKSEIKKKIINKRKQDSLNLFSRSHYSNIENSILIKFK